MYSYYNKEVECASEEELQKIQTERLIDMVYRCYNNLPLYKKRFDDMGLSPDDIKSLDDIKNYHLHTKTTCVTPIPWA